MFFLFTKVDSISTIELEQKLKKRGFDVVNVKGGMHAWKGKIV